MEQYTGYEKILQDEIQELLNTDRPIVIFGTLGMGMIAKKALDSLKIKPVCFADNKKEKEGTAFEGLRVFSPEEAYKRYPDAVVIICSFNEDNIQIIIDQVKELKFDRVMRGDMLFYYYQINIAGRKVDPSKLAETMLMINRNEKPLVLNTVSVFLTERCTLNCENCAAFIPFFKKPINYDKTTIINSMKRISDSVDAINVLTMFGGEPFLHPDLVEICYEASKLNNVKRINLITNGTILPKESDIRRMASMVTTIYISNYMELSVHKQNIKDLCKENNIILETDEEESLWTDLGKLEKNNRDESEKKRLFSLCWRASHNHMVLDGNFYPCSFSAFTSKLNKVPIASNELVRLLKEESFDGEIRKEIDDLYNNRRYITACDYCDLVLNRPAKSAVQIKR